MLWCNVIFFIRVEEINEFFFDGVKNIFFKLGLSLWFMLVNWNLYLKFVIVCNFLIKIVVCCWWVNFVSRLVKFIMVILFRFWVMVVINCMCLFSVNKGCLLGLVVMVIIILLNIWVVCLIKLVWLLVIGLKVLG